MSQTTWQARATQAAEKVYSDFLSEVVKKYVLKDLKKITGFSEFQMIRLMSISGKGGGSTVEEAQHYGAYHNVSLLDHLLSVVRGGLLLATLDWLSRNPDMDDELLMRKLYVIAVVGFMHDIDKDFGQQRIKDIESVSDADVAERMERYGIPAFLQTVDVQLEPAQLLYLIDKVESQQANRRLPENMPPHFADGALPLYVRMADKLDGAWLLGDYQDYDPKQRKNRIERVLDWLKKDKSCIRSEFLRDVFDQLEQDHVIDIFDPHHPFLLDELQRQLSAASEAVTGLPPLIEIHHDGRLVMLFLAIPQQLDEIKNQGIQSLTKTDSLPTRLAVFTGKKDEEVYLVNEAPSHYELWEFMDGSIEGEVLKTLFKVKSSYKGKIDQFLFDMLDKHGLSPVFQEKITGKTMLLYASLQKFDDNPKALYRLKQASHLILLLNLNLKEKPKAKDNVPTCDSRETELLTTLQQERPTWIQDIATDGHPRRVLTALWAIAIAIEQPELEAKIWGENGLLQTWLEGKESQKGLNQFIVGESSFSGEELENVLTTHFSQLLSGQRVISPYQHLPENKLGRCAFTDQPIPDTKRIAESMELKTAGVTPGIFSGRDKRPESVDTATPHNNISPISFIEYKLRAKKSTDINADLATRIYSPATLGLFGGLSLRVDQAINQMTLDELSTFDADHTTVLEHYSERYRLMRLDSMPAKLIDTHKKKPQPCQLTQVKKLLFASLRIGRPLHVFRGLPSVNRAFFAYDAMPSFLAHLLSDTNNPVRELRLEQIPMVLRRIETAEMLMAEFGYGYNAIELYAHPQTRFKGICLAYCVLAGKKQVNTTQATSLLNDYRSYFDNGELSMNENTTPDDGVMVKLGKAAAMIQRYPKKGWEAGNSEQTMVFNICMDSLKQALRLPTPQTDDTSLIHGITDQLMQVLDRRNLVSASKHRDGSFAKACMEVARIFVEDFWGDVMNRRFPSQDNLRILSSIYRMSFMQRARTENAQSDEPTEPSTPESF